MPATWEQQCPATNTWSTKNKGSQQWAVNSPKIATIWDGGTTIWDFNATFWDLSDLEWNFPDENNLDTNRCIT